MYSIGEFSKITGITVKTLRFYHEQGVLLPTAVDEQTGYRYYADTKIEPARIITRLRNLDFSLTEIVGILNRWDDEADILDHLERHQRTIQNNLERYREIHKVLTQIISTEREARTAMQNAGFEIEEKTVAPLLIAGVRMQGKYKECGQGFATIGRHFGRHICGKPMMLIYDTEYKEDDADFEPCMPIRKGTGSGGVEVRELPGGPCVTLLHKGPYEELGRSYERMIKYIQEKNYEIATPCREVYLKGPGMIFRGNPKKYLTEIQMFLKK